MSKISIIVGAFIKDSEGKILLISSKKWANKFSVPGGHLEYTEKLEDAVLREVFEETGLNVKIESFLGYQEAILDENLFKDKHYLVFDYLCSIVSGKLTESDEAESFIWADLNTKNISPFTKNSLLKYQAIINIK